MLHNIVLEGHIAYRQLEMGCSGDGNNHIHREKPKPSGEEAGLSTVKRTPLFSGQLCK